MTEKIKTARKLPPLKQHETKVCDCFEAEKPNSDKTCIYAEFPDQFTFQSDVGNGHSRGEIFTPAFIVNKMITDSGLFPRSAVYDGEYSTDVDTMKTAIESRVQEPAVGTANFTATIIWHKLEFANAFSRVDGHFDLNQYHVNLLKAIASTYAFDIDPGNLSTTKWRIAGNASGALNSKENVNFWVEELTKSLKRVSKKKIEKHIVSSLDDAEKHWGDKNSGASIVEKLYLKHSGEAIPNELLETVRWIMNSNIKLFNGIKEESEEFIPGWRHVEWNWWNIIDTGSLDNVRVTYKVVPLARMLFDGELNTLLKREKELLPNMELTFGSSTMPAEEEKLRSEKLSEIRKEITRLNSILSALPETYFPCMPHYYIDSVRCEACSESFSNKEKYEAHVKELEVSRWKKYSKFLAKKTPRAKPKTTPETLVTPKNDTLFDLELLDN